MVRIGIHRARKYRWAARSAKISSCASANIGSYTRMKLFELHTNLKNPYIRLHGARWILGGAPPGLDDGACPES